MRKVWGWILLVAAIFALSRISPPSGSDAVFSISYMVTVLAVTVGCFLSWLKLAIMSPKKEGK